MQYYKHLQKKRIMSLIVTPESQQQEGSSYIETQFFFYMLTCYYAIVAFSIRYNSIMKEPPEVNVNRLPGQFLIQCLENQPQFISNETQKDKSLPPPASYVIKSKLCLLNSYLYIFMLLFSIFGTEQLFYACNHRKYSIIYIFGVIAWTMGAIVLRRQYQRKINQSLWTHRIFWIFSGTFAVTKMFQDYLLPMNFALNCVSIGSNSILTIYGIYRAEDNDTLSLIDNEEIPGMFKLFFEYLQLNPLVRKILRIEDRIQRADDKIDDENLGEIDINALEEAFKFTNESRRQQMNLLNQLPRRNIFIDKKLQYIKNQNGTMKICYFIFTQIGNSRFEASRTYKQFMKVEEELSQIFNDKYFPKNVLPKFKKSEAAESMNQSEILQQWLVQVTKKPLFIVKSLLLFLNINQESSAPFLTYFDVSYKSFCSNAYMLSQLRKKQAKTNRVSLVGYFDNAQQGEKVIKSKKIIVKQKLQFLVEVDYQITDPKQYGFLFTCIRDTKNKQRIRWKLRKYEQNILNINYRIQQQCNISVDFYYHIVSNLTKKNHQSKAIAFCEYVQKLLSNNKYYCDSLFKFIRFDPIGVQVLISGVDSLKNLETQQKKRVSHYFQQYEDHQQNLVSVLRVDKTDGESQGQSFKFQLRRKSFILSRSSQQISKLRKDLTEIYHGVSFVPGISYEGCNKIQAKDRTQKFLRLIETLPKITANESFASFYLHTL